VSYGLSLREFRKYLILYTRRASFRHSDRYDMGVNGGFREEEEAKDGVLLRICQDDLHFTVRFYVNKINK